MKLGPATMGLGTILLLVVSGCGPGPKETVTFNDAKGESSHRIAEALQDGRLTDPGGVFALAYPGEVVEMSYRVLNPADSEGHTNLEQWYKVKDPKGKVVAEDKGTFIKDHAEKLNDPNNRAKLDKNLAFTLPLHCPTGRYRIELVVEDHSSNQTMMQAVGFEVDKPPSHQ